jgi:hypothetical protein
MRFYCVFDSFHVDMSIRFLMATLGVGYDDICIRGKCRVFKKPNGFYPNGSIHCMLFGSLFLVNREWPVELHTDPPFLDDLKWKLKE